MRKNYFLLMLLGFASQSIFAQTPVQAVDDFLNQAKSKGTVDTRLDYNVINENVVGDNKADYVRIQQTINGIPVYGSYGNFHVQQGKVINHNETFVYANNNKSLNVSPTLNLDQAIESMAAKLGKTLNKRSEQDLISQAKAKSKDVTPKNNNSVSYLKEAPSFLNYFNDNGEFKLAWITLTEIKNNEVDQSNPLGNLYETIIDAKTGELLSKKSVMNSCHFDEGVSKGNVYHNNPEDFKWVESAFAVDNQPISTAADAPLNGTYRVIPATQQSPLKSDFKLLTNTYDPVASKEGWHKLFKGATDYSPNVTKYHTVGNNAHVGYDKDGFASDKIFGESQLYILVGYALVSNEAYGGEKLLFDFPTPGNSMDYEPINYTSAATTQMFYSLNSIHDILHHHGFNPKAGSFQMNDGNKKRVVGMTTSGLGEYKVKNNAVMGYSPSLIKYPTTIFLTFETIEEGSGLLEIKEGSLKGSYVGSPGNNQGFQFGVSPAVTADMALAIDGEGTDVNDGCEEITNGAQLTGKIALVNRGNCNFTIKVDHIKKHNPAGILILNNDMNNPLAGLLEVGNPDLTYPIAGVAKDIGDKFKAALANKETISGTMPSTNFNYRKRDSGFDSQVILHEYTHAVSKQLSGDLIGGEEGMGEGWSDYVALNLTQQAYHTSKDLIKMGEYAFDGEGLRELPYTTDMKANPHTYNKLIEIGAGEGKEHPTGYVWALMLWELHWKMIDKYGFNPDFKSSTGGNNMTLDLVIEGLKIQKANPGFVDGRDGILMADVVLNGGSNQCLIWEAFAKRGLGYSADQGDPALRADGKEAFDLPPTCQRLGTDDLTTSEVSIYPNPVKDLVYINAKDNVEKYEIIDVTGRLIDSGNLTKNANVSSVSTSQLATGIYILKLHTDKGVVTKKIIKK